MLTGKVRNPCHFGFRHFISVDAAFANSMLMHTHHYPMCSFVVLIEEALEDMDDEVHRRVIVVEQQNAIKVPRFVCGVVLVMTAVPGAPSPLRLRSSSAKRGCSTWMIGSIGNDIIGPLRGYFSSRLD